MTDVYIFGFGLVVTVVVGFGLFTFIHANNRARASEGLAGERKVDESISDRRED